jgi:Spirocyclase AveC-like
MAITADPRELTHERLAAAPEIQERKLTPVKWWACFGAVVLAVQAYTYIRWFASGDVHASPTGPTHIPTSTLVWVRMWEVIGAGGALLAVVFLLARPWRRGGRITLDGMFVIIFFQLWSFQDAFVNYTVNQFQYNAAFVNVGSWYSWIPGWMAPRSHYLAEPILFVGGLYVWLFAVGLICLNWTMRRAKERWPQMGKLGIFLIAASMAAVLDFIFEFVWLQQNLYSYGAHINAVTLFPSKQYAFPLYEPLLWGITWGSYACLRYFRDDKGQLFVERGMDTIKASPRRKQGLRFLALLGAVNLGMLVLYALPYNWIGLEASGLPKDVLSRSYLTSGMCGVGTDYACPSSRLPVTVSSSQARFTPEGKLIAPSGIPVQPLPRGAKLLKDHAVYK